MRANELSPRVLGWLQFVLGRDARIGAVRPLDWATSSTLYEVDANLSGQEMRLVLRLYTKTEWLADEPDVPEHEAANLQRLRGSGLPVPELLAVDMDGSQCGVPALLMTRLLGKVNLTPVDFDAWLRQLAAFLPRLHAVSPAGHRWRHLPYNNLSTLEPPVWTRRPELWAEAIRIGRGPRPAFEPRFIHRDFHPVNLLFAGETLSGVVDWPNACVGPAGVDVAHCRLNLATMFGQAATDRFLELCRESMGAYWTYNPFWDLMSILDIGPGGMEVYSAWPAFGLVGLTPALLVERNDAYLESVLARF